MKIFSCLYVAMLSFMYFSFPVLAWETKEDFDRDFKQSVKQFLQNREEASIFYGNLGAFIKTHMNFLKEYNKFCTYDPSDPNRPWSGVMKDIKAFSDTELDQFDTFFCVGPKKALSNLPTHTFVWSGEIKSIVESWAAEMGYNTYTSAEPGKTGAMWVFDPDALSKLLTKNSALLREHGLSLDPLEFIKEIDKKDEKGFNKFDLSGGKARMFQLIARAFGREMSLEDIQRLERGFQS